MRNAKPYPNAVLRMIVESICGHRIGVRFFRQLTNAAACKYGVGLEHTLCVHGGCPGQLFKCYSTQRP